MSKDPKITSYGWLVQIDGKLREFATDEEALEAADPEEEDEEE